jgi:hypothetical protein
MALLHCLSLIHAIGTGFVARRARAWSIQRASPSRTCRLASQGPGYQCTTCTITLIDHRSPLVLDALFPQILPRILCTFYRCEAVHNSKCVKKKLKRPPAGSFLGQDHTKCCSVHTGLVGLCRDGSSPWTDQCQNWVDPTVPLVPGLVWFKSRNSSLIYIYTHTHIHTYTYTYIYRCKYRTNSVCKVTYICRAN